MNYTCSLTLRSFYDKMHLKIKQEHFGTVYVCVECQLIES